MVQFSHPNMTPGKIIALTRQTFCRKVPSLLFNMLSRFVIAFLPRSKHLFISCLRYHLPSSLLFHVWFLCFLTCIQISLEPGKVAWYSHLFKNFPQFVVIHTVKGFSIVHEAEVDVLLEFFCLFYDLMDVGNFISGSSAFSKSSLYIWKF